MLSVNNVSLEGVAHDAAVEMLQNAPDDVTLVVSQPKERLYQGKIFNKSVSSNCVQPYRTAEVSEWGI